MLKITIVENTDLVTIENWGKDSQTVTISHIPVLDGYSRLKYIDENGNEIQLKEQK